MRTRINLQWPAVVPVLAVDRPAFAEWTTRRVLASLGMFNLALVLPIFGIGSSFPAGVLVLLPLGGRS